MQLRNSRLCLDCEEVHDAQQCPVCASESFAFLTRWVPAPERRERPRMQEPANATPSGGARPEELHAYRALLDPSYKPNGRGWQLVRQGAMGLALVGVAGWLWKSASAEADKAGAAARAEKEPK